MSEQTTIRYEIKEDIIEKNTTKEAVTKLCVCLDDEQKNTNQQLKREILDDNSQTSKIDQEIVKKHKKQKQPFEKNPQKQAITKLDHHEDNEEIWCKEAEECENKEPMLETSKKPILIFRIPQIQCKEQMQNNKQEKDANEGARLSQMNCVIRQFCPSYYIVLQLMTPTKIETIINSTAWHTIHVFSNPNSTKITGISMNQYDFNLAIMNQFRHNNINNIDLIPIGVSDKNKTHVEYVWIVPISQLVTIGISLNYIPQINDIKVMAIYLGKQQIQKQLAIPHHSLKFNCLNDLSTDIYTLIINEDSTQYFGGWQSQSESGNYYDEWDDDEESSRQESDIDEQEEKVDQIGYK